MGSDHNLTPDQLQIPKPVRRESYKRIPETCDLLRAILNEMQQQIMKDFDIDPADEATIDAATSAAFLRIRNEITQNFRTEHMKLLLKEIK